MRREGSKLNGSKREGCFVNSDFANTVFRVLEFATYALPTRSNTKYIFFFKFRLFVYSVYASRGKFRLIKSCFVCRYCVLGECQQGQISSKRLFYW